MPLRLVVWIYNEAGERVRTLFEGAAQAMPLSLQLDASVLRPGAGGAGLLLPGAASGRGGLTWAGDNDAGQRVRGGVYYFKAEFEDPFGVKTALIAPIQVVEAPPPGRLAVFNPAGELVFEEILSGLAASATDLDLLESSIAFGYDADGGVQKPLQAVLRDGSGASQAWSWDGRSQRGMPVEPGAYLLRLESEGPQGRTVVLRQVQVLKGPDSAGPPPAFGPSPARAGAALQVRYAPRPGESARCGLHNLAGERVREAQGAGGGVLTLETRGLAGGVYVVVFERRLGGVSGRRQVFKVALLP